MRMRERPHRRWRRTVALAGIAVVAAVAAGCGIRTTSVPVDAGGAPSRLPCSVSGTPVATQAQGGVPVRVYLVCASGLEAVERSAVLPGPGVRDARVATARALLEQLRERPSEAERDAGFTTYVQEALTVAGGRAGDPAGALRLSRQPEDLSPSALSQIVCTYAESEATAVSGEALLGGPGDYPVRRYQCPASLKERPESAVPSHVF
ncbi:hypothetical protein [Streptomyces sp. NPDC047928]|uniref:hypothetical protein n=1 Tax=unclassified Streptomyces TaxID=2593676 RepID=UPI0037209175